MPHTSLWTPVNFAQNINILMNLTKSMVAQKLFAELEKNIEKEASLMAECFSKSQKAFKQDKKEEAKALSEEGKKHQELMQKYQNQSSEEMLKFM